MSTTRPQVPFSLCNHLDGQRMQISIIDDGNPFDINQADDTELNIPLDKKMLAVWGYF